MSAIEQVTEGRDEWGDLGDAALELGDASLKKLLLLVRDGTDGEDLGDSTGLWGAGIETVSSSSLRK